MKKNRNMSISELIKPYPYPIDNQQDNMTYRIKRKIDKDLLQNQYNYYLKRYMNAYNQYLMYNSPYYGNNKSKATELKPIVLKLNNIIKDIAKNIELNVKTNQKELIKRKQIIDSQNNDIAVNYRNLDVLNTVIKNKGDQNISESQLLVDSKQLVNNARIVRNIYLVSVIIALHFMGPLFYIYFKDII